MKEFVIASHVAPAYPRFSEYVTALKASAAKEGVELLAYKIHWVQEGQQACWNHTIRASGDKATQWVEAYCQWAFDMCRLMYVKKGSNLLKDGEFAFLMPRILH